MEKIKAFLIRYKWWIVAAIVSIGGFFIWRSRSAPADSSGAMEGAGPMVVQPSQVMQPGAGTGAVDNTMALAALQAQTQLALAHDQLQAKNSELQAGLDTAQMQKDLEHYKIETGNQLGNAQLAVQKYLGKLTAETQTQLADLNSQTLQYQSNINLQIQQSKAGVAGETIDAQKYIADKQAYIAGKEISNQRHGQDIQAGLGVLNFIGGFF